MGTYNPEVVEAVPALNPAAVSQTIPARKRQRRSLAEKRRIVEETLIAGASVARVARAHGVNANQVFQWRHLYRRGRLGTPGGTSAPLLPVRLTEESLEVERESQAGRSDKGEAGSIQLELPKARIRIQGNIELAVLRLVLQSVLP